MSSFERQFEPVEALGQFIDINELNGQIGDQNQRHEDAYGIDDEGFRSLVHEGLADEQSETIAAMSNVVSTAPYEAVANESLSLDASLGALALELNKKKIEAQTDYDHIDQQADLAMKLSPKKAELIRQLAEQRKQDITDKILAASQAQLKNLTALRSEIDFLYEEAGKPWPIPQATEERVEWRLEPAADGEQDIFEDKPEFIDQIPVTPNLTSVQDKTRADRIRQHHVDAPRASIFITLYLAERKGQVVTVQELVDFLYNDEVRAKATEYHLRSRVTSLLGPKIQGIRIRTMLADEGLVLQYGNRQTRNPDGSWSRPTRIYRAVGNDEFGASQSEISETIQEKVSFSPSPDALPYVEKPIVLFMPEQRASSPPSDAAEAHTNEKLAWIRPWRQAIGEAIDELSAVLKPGTMEAHTVSLLVNSKKVGTIEAVERLINAGILRAPGGRNARLGQVHVDASEIVAMHLFNSHRQLLGQSNKVRQKEAIKILRDSVQRFLDKNFPPEDDTKKR